MNLNQIERIIFIARLGSITEAARKLNVSQPSLSQIISNVEQEIGMQIFRRHTQPLKLTPAGESFISSGKQMLRIKDSMMKTMQSIGKGETGTINIGVTVRRCHMTIEKILPEFFAEFPGVTIRFIEAKSFEYEKNILQGTIDIAISNTPPIDIRIESHRLQNELFYFAVAKGTPLEEKLESYVSSHPGKSVPISEVCNERFIVTAEGMNSRLVFTQLMRSINASPNIVMEAPSIDAAIRLASTGEGIAMVPLLFPANTVITENMFDLNDKLSYYIVDNPHSVRETYLMYSREMIPTDAHTRLIMMLLDKFEMR